MNKKQNHCCQGKCSCRKAVPPQIPSLNTKEKAILGDLKIYHYLPLCRFIMSKKDEGSVRFIALAPVYLQDKMEDMASIKATAKALEALADKKIITLDYDIALKGYDYSYYETSQVYNELQAAVAAGSQKPGFLCDTAELEQGSIALTQYGQELLDYVETP